MSLLVSEHIIKARHLTSVVTALYVASFTANSSSNSFISQFTLRSAEIVVSVMLVVSNRLTMEFSAWLLCAGRGCARP